MHSLALNPRNDAGFARLTHPRGIRYHAWPVGRGMSPGQPLLCRNPLSLEKLQQQCRL